MRAVETAGRSQNVANQEQKENVIRKISSESVTRERRKLKKLNNRLNCDLLTFEDVVQSYKSWDGHASRFDSHKTRKSMEKLFTDLFLRSDQQNEILQNQAGQ